MPPKILQTTKRKNKERQFHGRCFQPAQNEHNPVTKDHPQPWPTPPVGSVALAPYYNSIIQVRGLVVVDPYSEEQQQAKTADTHRAA
jgi:hypothetical protein